MVKIIRFILVLICVVCLVQVHYVIKDKPKFINSPPCATFPKVAGKNDVFEQSVYVASHRRSGTHGFMNLLANHFGNKTGRPLKIKKLNHLAVDNVLGCGCLEAMFASGTIIYTERSFDAVLQSMFYYMKHYSKTLPPTFNEFLRDDEMITRIAADWNHTTTTWNSLAEKRPGMVLAVRFEEMITPTNKTLDRIANFLRRDRNDKPGKRDKGVLVGAGKGMVSPSHEASARAEWALQNLRHKKRNQHNYRMNGNFGNETLDAYSCTQVLPDLSSCPEIWHKGEVIYS